MTDKQERKCVRIFLLFVLSIAAALFVTEAGAEKPAGMLPPEMKADAAEAQLVEPFTPPESDIILHQDGPKGIGGTEKEPGIQRRELHSNADAGYPTVYCSYIGGSYIFEETTWGFTICGGTGPYWMTYELVEKVMENGKEEYYLIYKVVDTTDQGFHYRFTVNGNYEIWATVTDTYGRRGSTSVSATVNVPGYDRFTVSIVAPSSYAVNQVATWRAVASGGAGNYQYHFFLVALDPAVEGEDIVATTKEHQQSNTFSYKILANGKYRLQAVLYDGAGQSTAVHTDFTVNSSGGMTIVQRADQILQAAQRQGCTTDYDYAKYAHEWLVRNADYDYDSPTHFGADGALMGGKAVCGGYAKAFQLLMNIANVPCEIVSSDVMDHAWNVVKLGDQWYMVDSTWDDGSAGIGFDNHWYCFVPRNVLNTDHHDYYCSRTCNSVDANYYVLEEIASPWLDELSYSIWEKLQEGSYRFTVPFPASCEAEGHTYIIDSNAFVYNGQTNLYEKNTMSMLCDMIIRKYIPNFRSYYYGNGTVDLDVKTYNGYRTAYVSMDFTGRTLELPAGLKSIEGEAFSGDSGIMAVIVPESVTEIRGRAFSGCTNLWKIVLKNPNTRIYHAAIPTNTGHLCIVAAENSTGQKYASENGLWWTASE